MTKCSQCGDPGKDDPCNWCAENPAPTAEAWVDHQANAQAMRTALERIYAALDGAEDAKDACMEIAESVAAALGKPSPLK